MSRRKDTDDVQHQPFLHGINAEVRIRTDMRHAQALYRSLQPEMATSSKIGDVKITLNKEGLLLNIDAKETAKMRAGISSYLRLIKAATETLKTVD